MEYVIRLTIDTDFADPAAWPDESVAVGAVVSVLTEAGEELLGRVVGIRFERVEV